jgi:hypothetical protein
VVVYLVYPEMKGPSLEDIVFLFDGRYAVAINLEGSGRQHRSASREYKCALEYDSTLSYKSIV